MIFGSRSVLLGVLDLLVANLYLQNVFLRSDETKLKFKKKKNQNRIEEDEERKKKKRKKLTTE